MIVKINGDPIQCPAGMDSSMCKEYLDLLIMVAQEKQKQQVLLHDDFSAVVDVYHGAKHCVLGFVDFCNVAYKVLPYDETINVIKALAEI